MWKQLGLLKQIKMINNINVSWSSSCDYHLSPLESTRSRKQRQTKQKEEKKEMINDRKWNNVTPGSSNLRICLFSVFMTRSFPRRAREIGNMPTIQSLAFALHILPVRCKWKRWPSLYFANTTIFVPMGDRGDRGDGHRPTEHLIPKNTNLKIYVRNLFFFCYLRLCFAYRSAFHMQWENTKATRGIKNVVFFFGTQIKKNSFIIKQELGRLTHILMPQISLLILSCRTHSSIIQA